MELTKDSIIKSFEDGIAEVRNLNADRGLNNGWIVCDEKDSLPIRKDDKDALHFFGGKVWVANSAHYAEHTARELNSKARKAASSVRLVVLPISLWAERRIAVLENILAEWKASAK